MLDRIVLILCLPFLSGFKDSRITLDLDFATPSIASKIRKERVHAVYPGTAIVNEASRNNKSDLRSGRLMETLAARPWRGGLTASLFLQGHQRSSPPRGTPRFYMHVAHSGLAGAPYLQHSLGGQKDLVILACTPARLSSSGKGPFPSSCLILRRGWEIGIQFLGASTSDDRHPEVQCSKYQMEQASAHKGYLIISHDSTTLTHLLLSRINSARTSFCIHETTESQSAGHRCSLARGQPVCLR